LREETRQRLRIKFAKGEEIKYISHLDLMRAWERALRRAGIPISYSHGFNPRPKIAIASPLPVGFTSRGEVMDIVLSRRTSPYDFAKRLIPSLPPGLEILSVEEVYQRLPSLQSQVRFSEYRVKVEWDNEKDELEKRLQEILSSENLPRRRRGKDYNLRPLIESIWVEECGEGRCVLGMRLKTGEQGTGRPDDVLDELGLSERIISIERERLIFDWELEDK